jgi:hypothetical protein
VALQRFHRDAHAVAHRDGLIIDLGRQQYGKVALGLEPDGGIWHGTNGDVILF